LTEWRWWNRQHGRYGACLLRGSLFVGGVGPAAIVIVVVGGPGILIYFYSTIFERGYIHAGQCAIPNTCTGGSRETVSITNLPRPNATADFQLLLWFHFLSKMAASCCCCCGIVGRKGQRSSWSDNYTIVVQPQNSKVSTVCSVGGSKKIVSRRKNRCENISHNVECRPKI
jgi:hypothetical protein